MKKIIIAIDGHSSTGKSTLASMLSNYLNYRHINTGSMYRAITLYALRNKLIIDLGVKSSINSDAIIHAADSINLEFKFDHDGVCKMYMNSEDVDYELKSPLVSKYVSQISTYPLLRQKIVKKQQIIGRSKGVVMEGRDIGSVVFPNAEVKLFITASIEVRAQRRYQELINLGVKTKLSEVLNNLEMRDFSDSNRKDSPLYQVNDAILIDNTSLTIDEQFNTVIELLDSKKNLL